MLQLTFFSLWLLCEKKQDEVICAFSSLQKLCKLMFTTLCRMQKNLSQWSSSGKSHCQVKFMFTLSAAIETYRNIFVLDHRENGFFFSFYSCIWSIWKFPGQGLNQSCSCRPTPQPQQCRIRVLSETYATAYGKAGSLTHWAGPSSWRHRILNPLSHNGNSHTALPKKEVQGSG